MDFESVFRYIYIICGMKIIDASGSEVVEYQSKLRLSYIDQTDELYSVCR
jgi:hypothetical protein